VTCSKVRLSHVFTIYSSDFHINFFKVLQYTMNDRQSELRKCITTHSEHEGISTLKCIYRYHRQATCMNVAIRCDQRSEHLGRLCSALRTVPEPKWVSFSSQIGLDSCMKWVEQACPVMLHQTVDARSQARFLVFEEQNHIRSLTRQLATFNGFLRSNNRTPSQPTTTIQPRAVELLENGAVIASLAKSNIEQSNK
jgi:hypothetical protein